MGVPGRLVRRLAPPVADVCAWVVGMQIAGAARVDWHVGAGSIVSALGLALVAGSVQVVVGSGTHLYRRRHQVGSLQEALLLALVVAVAGLVVAVVSVLAPAASVPGSVPVMATAVTLALAAGARLAVRVRRDAARRPDLDSALRVVVYGAGRTGAQLVRSMTADPWCGLHTVAFLDDDPWLLGQHVCGVPVLGNGIDLAAIVRRTGSDLIVIAMRNPDGDLVCAIRRAAADVGVRVKVVRPLREQLESIVGVADLREIDINELLGRRPVETDVGLVSPIITGRRVLVTGAGGSIGSELCRQIAVLGPAELLMLDRDESALHAVQLSIYGRALLDSPDVILADIRDADALAAVFLDRRPDIVFHAAALKHLPMLEQYPDEAWKTNVLGTINVLAAAVDHQVEHLVNISTDKAADPTSVLGRSKRVGERLVADTAHRTGRTYLSVRFGNVLGSRGSVVTTFVEQMVAGIPVTVTHPDVSRFFMTVPEAVQLVLQAAALGRPGHVHVLDMGGQVRIVELARRLMDAVGTEVPMVFTGLRPGEKLHEDLFGEHESQREVCHPSITAVPVPTLSPEDVAAAEPRRGVRGALVELSSHARPVGDEGLSPVAVIPDRPLEASRFLDHATQPMLAQP